MTTSGWLPNGWLPTSLNLKSTVLELCQIEDPYFFWENNSEIDLLEKLNQESEFNGFSLEWLEKELSLDIPYSSNDPIVALRKFRQDYLFETFLDWHWRKRKSSFILDGLIRKLKSDKSEMSSNSNIYKNVEEVDYHTIVLLDGVGKLMHSESESILNIPKHDSFDILVGIDNSIAGNL